ncbi:MAG: alpha/beta hydrolase [Acidimicrobiia bacterium]
MSWSAEPLLRDGPGEGKDSSWARSAVAALDERPLVGAALIGGALGSLAATGAALFAALLVVPAVAVLASRYPRLAACRLAAAFVALPALGALADDHPFWDGPVLPALAVLAVAAIAQASRSPRKAAVMVGQAAAAGTVLIGSGLVPGDVLVRAESLSSDPRSRVQPMAATTPAPVAGLGRPSAVAAAAVVTKLRGVEASTVEVSPPANVGGRPLGDGLRANTAAQHAELERLRALTLAPLVFFDPGNDAAAAVLGDLRRAAHVAILLDGTGSDLPSVEQKSRALLNQACPDPQRCDTAVVAFDYAPPSWEMAALPGGRGRAGRPADDLVTLAGNVRREAGPDATVTVIGHSYGSLVVGLSLARGLDVDRAVFTGAMGVGADSVADLGTGAVVYNGLAAGDDVAEAAACSLAAYANPLADRSCGRNRYGASTATDGFGALPLDVTGGPGHNKYFHPGTTSVISLAAVVNLPRP